MTGIQAGDEGQALDAHVKTSIYLPDDLAEEARAYGISISEVARLAIHRAVEAARVGNLSPVERAAMDAWVASEFGDAGMLAAVRAALAVAAREPRPDAP